LATVVSFRYQPQPTTCNLEGKERLIATLGLKPHTLLLETPENNINLAPWPEIHPQARLAKVPIIMYHDIVAEKEVFFDVTPAELEAHFQMIREKGLTPISMDWLISHLRTGIPLPEKPILLSFDDGYGGHYKYVYPLLKKYGYPAVFSIYIRKMDGKTARSSVTWEQLQEMTADPLVTIASHSITHPRDLRELSDTQLEQEVRESKQILEKALGIPIRYFTYPEGKHDERVKQAVLAAGYRGALAMDNFKEFFAGESPDLLSLGRFGQSGIAAVSEQAWGGEPVPVANEGFNFNTVITHREVKVKDTSLILISGGIPRTIHAPTRSQVPEIIAGTGAEAAVDGGFFSLKYLDSNTMIGPVLSPNGGFIAGYEGELDKLADRPLVLITPRSVLFVPFDPDSHNTLEGIQSLAADAVTDAFVAAAWLVRDGEAQPREAFGSLFDFDAVRHRAFWGINVAGQPVIGVTKDPIDSVSLGEMLQQLGFRDAVMLDSGASTSLAYRGESLVGYIPRPVPHVVALFPAPNPVALGVPLYHVGLPCVLDQDSCN
jgi:peptidoglycan/xylan/chitin deacetylase (PgdA/CDA1 family)